MAPDNFPFIVSSGPKLRDDPSTRTIIRKQAMKEIGFARRKRKQGGRVAAEQVSASEDTDTQIQSSASSDSGADGSTTESSESSRITDDTEFDEFLPRRDEMPRASSYAWLVDKPAAFSTISLSSSYELARAKFRIDVTDLSMLTNFHVSKSSTAVLVGNAANLATLLSARQWSYMEYIPSRYGTSDCLTAATNCVLATVRSVLAPQEFDNQEFMLQLYAKALQTLQEALSDKSTCMDADVLCATELLSLHELLDPTRKTAWEQHICGSTRLVRLRTPKRFQTEFEKALFAGHVGPAMSASLLDNTHCYLAEPEWMELYRSLVKDTDALNDRSSLTINIRSVMFRLSGLWHDIDSAVRSDALFDDAALQPIRARSRKLQQDVLAWTEDYKNHCVRRSFTSPPAEELEMRRELFGCSVECLMVNKRFLATLYDDEREQLEIEVQALASLLLDLQNQPSSKHSWLFTGSEVGIAYAARLTKDQWEGSFSYASEFDRRVASRTRFITWTEMMRAGG